MQFPMWTITALFALLCNLGTALNLANLTFNPLSGMAKAKGVQELADIKRNMSVDRALALLDGMDNVDDQLYQYVKTSLQKTGLLQNLAGSLRSHKPTGYGGLQSAKAKLNEMIHETAVKIDLELIRCSTYERSQTAYIEKLRQDISTFNAAASAAASEMLRAQAEISIYQEKLPQAKYDLQKLLKECKQSKLELERQLRIVKADISVMERVMDMTDCKSTMMLMLQCKDPVTGQTYFKYDDSLVQQVASLQHPESTKLMKEILYPTDAEAEEGLPMLAFAQDVDRKLSQPMSPPASPAAPSKSKQRAKCSIAGSPMCPKLRERFMDIATGIEDKRKDLEAALRQLEKHCAESKSRLEAKIALYETLLKKEETALAQATSEKVNNEEQSRLTQIELEKAVKEFNAMIAECKLNIGNMRTEKCGLEKIRGELFKMKGDKVFFQDCDVTDWTASECTATCGGGTQSLSRTITAYPVGGSACPPLTATQSCNEDNCPVDCVLEDWTAWSGCSAECGGGVRSKSREVKVTPEHGGDPCGETSKTESCNIQACDVPCELSQWTAWGLCSKKCDSGSLTRVKNVVVPAVGQGKCPPLRGPERLQSKPCNTQPCKNESIMMMQCVAKLDVILLLDGSGSLGQKGWEQTVKAGATLARSMKGDVTLGVLLFSGPTNYNSLWMCTGEISGTPNMVDDCGIQWVDHFTNDTDKVASDIEALTFPSKTTLTSLAISSAENELSQGRQDATSVVIVITDGKPLSEKSTTLASASIKKKARLMWVPVGRYVPKKDVKKWASFPWPENVVTVDDFGQLTKPEILNRIIADMCPDIPTERT